MTAAEVLIAIGSGEFDEGEQLRRIVNAAQTRAKFRTRATWPIGSSVRIDAGASTTKWNGVAGRVVKTNPTTVVLEAPGFGRVTVPISMLRPL